MKIYYEAIRAMDEAWVDDNTQVVAIDGRHVIMVSKDREPMVYCGTHKKWEAMQKVNATHVHPAPGGLQ